MEPRPAILDCPHCHAPMLILRTRSRRAGSATSQVTSPPIEFDRCPACEIEWFDFDELEQLLGAARRTLWVMTEVTIPAEQCARCGYHNPAVRRFCEQCVQPLRYDCPCDESVLEARTLFTATIHFCQQCQGVLLPAGHAQKLFDDYRLWLASTRRAELRLENVFLDVETVFVDVGDAPPRCAVCGLVGLARELRPDQNNRLLCGICVERERRDGAPFPRRR